MRRSKTLACPVIVCRSTYFLSKPFLSRKDFFLLLQQIFRWLRVSLMSSPSGFIHDKVGVANRSGSLFLKKISNVQRSQELALMQELDVGKC
jgi:hypothetical protein